jgi:CRP-like cAMP-binding protein
MVLDQLPESVRCQVVARELIEGEPLFRQGDPAWAIFDVVTGRLRLVRRTVDDHLVALYTARPR